MKAKGHGISTMFLAAPTTPPIRLALLDRASTGFLYCVSVTGVTGERNALAEDAEQFLRQARSLVKNNPILVGFGISTPEDAKRIAALSDGVIIGSALIRTIQNAPAHCAVEEASRFVRTIRKALDELLLPRRV